MTVEQLKYLLIKKGKVFFNENDNKIHDFIPYIMLETNIKIYVSFDGFAYIVEKF